MADLSFLYKFTKGNETKIKRYIKMYLSIAPDIFDRMKADIESQNWADLAINAHSLKPQVDYMGIPELKETLVEIENKVKNNEIESLKNLFEKALQLHQESAIDLENKMNLL